LEKFIFAEMQTMMKAKGMQGGLLMRYQGQPAAYLTVTFWDSRGDWYSCKKRNCGNECARIFSRTLAPDGISPLHAFRAPNSRERGTRDQISRLRVYSTLGARSIRRRRIRKGLRRQSFRFVQSKCNSQTVSRSKTSRQHYSQSHTTALARKPAPNLRRLYGLEICRCSQGEGEHERTRTSCSTCFGLQ
jgi:hypothetical protein